MTGSSPNGHSQTHSNGRKNPFGRRSAGGIAVVLLLAVYGFAQPKLNERFGWNLPGLKQDGRGQVVVDSSSKNQNHQNQHAANENSVTRSDADANAKSPSRSPSESLSESKQQSPPSTKDRGPLAERMDAKKFSPTSTESNKTRGSPAAKSSDKEVSDGDRLYGILRDTGGKRYVSPAGLLYTPGSAEGHRLEHLRRHTVDNPSRPIHGVFDGDMSGALKVIDQAYERAKKGQRTTKKIEDGRTVYTVDMGKRIGFVGGQTGRRKRNPMARRVKLVLDGNRVITAFPL